MHALVGENGAGKSTLGRIVAGEVSRDGGSMLLGGDAGLVPLAARGARARGRGDRAGALDRPAADAWPRTCCSARAARRRLRPPAEPRAGVRRARRDRRLRARRATMSAGRLRTAEQQKVEILRALSRDAELIVMDEPSAALSAHETRQLHEIVRALARRRDDDPPDLALPARGARARRHGHRAARRRGRADGRGVGGDRGVADRGDARPAADVDVPAQAVPRRATRRSCSRCATCTRPASTDASFDAPRGRDPRRSPGSSAPGAPSWRAPSSAPRACSRARSVLESGGGARAAARAGASRPGSR